MSWHYSTVPLEAIQAIVDAEDWISEVAIFGGYARALLGYPVFPEPKLNGEEREKFGPGHDIDIGFKTDPEKTLMAFEEFRRIRPDLWQKYSFERHGYLTTEEFLEKTKELIKRGHMPDIITLMLETKHGDKLGPYPLSWTGIDRVVWESFCEFIDQSKPVIRIKPKPIEVYALGESQDLIVPVIILMLLFVGIPIAWWISWQVTT